MQGFGRFQGKQRAYAEYTAIYIIFCKILRIYIYIYYSSTYNIGVLFLLGGTPFGVLFKVVVVVGFSAKGGSGMDLDTGFPCWFVCVSSATPQNASDPLAFASTPTGCLA